MPRRVLVATSGHLASCPRMVKAATSLIEAGYAVRVVSTSHIPRLAEHDRQIAAALGCEWTRLDWGGDTDPFARVRSGVRQRAATLLAARAGPERCGLALLGAAFTRMHTELADAIADAPADLYYGGGGGAISAVALAAERRRRAYAVDLEDFHTGVAADAAGARGAILTALERRVIRGARFVTAGSRAIAGAYTRAYGVPAIPICNTFELPSPPPLFTPPNGHGMRLYWFGQTIGPDRGLEDCIRAIGAASIPAGLDLRGTIDGGYAGALAELAARSAPRVSLRIHEPAAPDRMLALCEGYDVGLALEPGTSPNARLALSNKVCTYPLAGLAMVLTDTPGQRPVIDALGPDAIVFAPGDVQTLAAGLRAWHGDPESVVRAKRASWSAARRRWHWAHAEDRGALLAAVASVVA